MCGSQDIVLIDKTTCSINGLNPIFQKYFELDTADQVVWIYLCIVDFELFRIRMVNYFQDFVYFIDRLYNLQLIIHYSIIL